MKALRLHGPLDLRLESVSEPRAPLRSEALIRVDAVGICGSDLHMVQDGRIGDTEIASPAILGHEFMGTIIACGDGARDGENRPLSVGQRVAVDPACPCWRCEWCEHGHPNLCPNHRFFGVYPEDGALRERMIVPARNCFPMPDSISDGAGTLLETLGVALHAVDLGHLRTADSVAVIGCGPVGLLIVQLALRSGGLPVYAFDPLPWRLEKARDLGAVVFSPDADPRTAIQQATGGRGVDVVFEAAWANETVQLAADIVRIGGSVVLVGIPGDDRLMLQHSTARRKGLTLSLVRRMKHTYPRAIRLATARHVDLDGLISHCVTLEAAGDAFARNLRYEPGIHKIVIAIGRDQP